MKTYTYTDNFYPLNLITFSLCCLFSAYTFAQTFEFTRNIIDSDTSWVYGMHAADLDQDGDVDAFTANWGGNNFRWYENDGTGTFTIHSIDNAATGASFITAADIDSDGDVDVLGVKWGSNAMDWYENDGNENFTRHQLATGLSNPQTASIVDIEGDGDQDILLTTSDGLTLYTNDGTESFTTSSLSTETTSVYVSTSDIDEDGDFDVLLTAWSGIHWYENDGSGNFTSHTLNTSIPSAYAVIAADLDGDNDVDIVSTSNGDNSILWYENDGNESFTTHTIASQNKARGLAVADLDKDGYMDVLVASQAGAGDVYWYKNDGSQSFTTQLVGVEAGNHNFVYAADFDGDGTDLDVLTMNSTVNRLSWYESELMDSIAPTIISSATATINENSGAGQVVYMITADDNVGVTSYGIGGTDASDFSVNATTGAVTLTADPDYETKSSYEFTVTASDAAGNTSAAQTVTLSINDLDDIAPELFDMPEGNHDEGVATIDLTLSEDVSLSGESIAGDFTITGAASNPVVSSLSVSGSEVTLTLSGVVVQGETVYLSYTKSVNAGSIVDASGNRLGDFSGQEVNFVTFDLNEPKGTEIFFTNPVRDRLEIRSESVVKRVALYSLTGRKVLDQRPNRQSPSIDISSLAQAIYLMSVETETNQITVKLVKR